MVKIEKNDRILKRRERNERKKYCKSDIGRKRRFVRLLLGCEI